MECWSRLQITNGILNLLEAGCVFSLSVFHHDPLAENARRKFDAVTFQVFHALRANPGANESPFGSSFRIYAILNKAENVLHDDRVVFHPANLGDVSDLSWASLQTVGLYDQVNRRRDLSSHRLDRHFKAAHHDHCF